MQTILEIKYDSHILAYPAEGVFYQCWEWLWESAHRNICDKKHLAVNYLKYFMPWMTMISDAFIFFYHSQMSATPCKLHFCWEDWKDAKVGIGVLTSVVNIQMSKLKTMAFNFLFTFSYWCWLNSCKRRTLWVGGNLQRTFSATILPWTGTPFFHLISLLKILWTLPIMRHPNNFCSTSLRGPFQFTLLADSDSTWCTD